MDDEKLLLFSMQFHDDGYFSVNINDILYNNIFFKKTDESVTNVTINDRINALLTINNKTCIETCRNN